MRRLLTFAIASATILSATPAAQALVLDPAFELRQPRTEIDGYRDRSGGWVSFDIPLWIQAPDAPFEVHVGRNATTDPIVATWQSGAGPRALPGAVSSWSDYGLSGFIDLTIRDDGEKIRHRRVAWCPNTYTRTRIGPGASEAVYPQVCGGNPFTRWQVWGIERGWAAGTDLYLNFRLQPGTYTLEFRIPKAYRDALALGPTLQTYELTVRNGGWFGGPIPPYPLAAARNHDADPTGPKSIGKQRPTNAQLGEPGAGFLGPDLASLPAWGIRLESYGGSEVLTFGATVWNAGPDALVVEGFRRDDEAIMDAFQLFEDDTYASVGTFEYDDRPGHDHWHFLDFARYQLLTADESFIVRSQKEAFCLAPTDAEDLLVDGATWRPDTIGFSECGYTDSVSIREVLQAGWGDTYFQGLPGQSFDVTSLPDGDYLIEVTANPEGNLIDATDANDRALREVTLYHDARGRRRVSVAPYLGPL
jgi:hypothetical protein